MFPSLMLSRSNWAGARLRYLHGVQHFLALVEIERKRVDRSGRSLALAALNFAKFRDDPWPLVGCAQKLQQRIRATDHAGFLEPSCLGIILWETSEDAARSFVDELTSSLPAGERPDILISLYPQPRFGTRPRLSL